MGYLLKGLYVKISQPEIPVRGSEINNLKRGFEWEIQSVRIFRNSSMSLLISQGVISILVN